MEGPSFEGPRACGGEWGGGVLRESLRRIFRGSLPSPSPPHVVPTLRAGGPLLRHVNAALRNLGFGSTGTDALACT